MYVAPWSGTGAFVASRPMTPVPQLSMLGCSLRSNAPHLKVRRNFDRIVSRVTEWVGGAPSTPASTRGALYQLWRVIQRCDATRRAAETKSVAGTVPISGTLMYSA